MLILSRRIGETIIIGDDIYLTVLGIKGNQIRLGFDAPERIAINRQEIHLKLQDVKTTVDNTLNHAHAVISNQTQASRPMAY